MVEDILQASLPGFVDAVRIADVGQGTNPLRIVSMRALPDQPGHPDYPREEWVGLDQAEDSKEQQLKADALDEDTDQTGDYLVSLLRFFDLYGVEFSHVLWRRTTRFLFPIKLSPVNRRSSGSITSILCLSSSSAPLIGSGSPSLSTLSSKDSWLLRVCACNSCSSPLT